MKKQKFILLMLAMTLFVACNNKPRTTAAEQDVDGFYDQKAANRASQNSESATTDGADRQKTGIKMYEVPARLKDRPEIILQRKAFTISYNQTTKTPNWVAWHLTKTHTYGNNQREMQAFDEDQSVPRPRATLSDYYNSRYDRGHMCPAGDNKWDEESMGHTFLLSNICPQNHGLNKYGWNDLEILCRGWAREYGAVDIVCGPIYRTATYSDGKMKPSSQQKFIGKNKVWVPDAFFKVVLCRNRNPKAIGFIYENRGGKQQMSQCATSVDEIERITGIDFYPLLADEVEERIEAEYNLRHW
ncbi:MAG: DNA/RNA non-specific endonuclease [Prevotella sp.]|nr:DNA/RNA non-specific endonuclease [Prevotella sp.]